MELGGKRIGFALTGSFCTLSKVLAELENLKKTGADILPLMSEAVWLTDTRFGSAESIKEKIRTICGREIIHDIVGAEPIGPKHIIDALVIAPCTGNTLSKIANGITDSCVSMAAKANLRNKCPLLLAISTNDGLGANGKNIGTLFNVPNVFFVPFGQDDPVGKPDSLVAHMSLLIPALECAFDKNQIQPLLK